MRAAAVPLAVILLLAGCRRTSGPMTQDDFVLRAWDAYKAAYIHPDGYVLDRTRNSGEVTSEGQGYALLRAVWMRDEATFTQVLDWTESRLRRPDGLYSWRWSPEAGGHVRDVNTATDADQEAAFALILASVVFGKPEVQGQGALPSGGHTGARIDCGSRRLVSGGRQLGRERAGDQSLVLRAVCVPLLRPG